MFAIDKATLMIGRKGVCTFQIQGAEDALIETVYVRQEWHTK